MILGPPVRPGDADRSRPELSCRARKTSPLELVGTCFGALIGLGLFAFWIWMLVDCAQNEPSKGNDKVAWILIIVLTGFVGAALYFLVRRPNRPGPARLAARRRSARA